MMKNNHNQGFSLIEMIIYIAIFSFISIVVINSFIVTLSAYQVTKTNRNLQESGSSVIERVSREIRSAKQIVNIDDYSITLIKEDSAGADRHILLKGEAPGVINLYQDGALIGNLLSQNILATDLTINRITTAHGNAIRIELTLKDNNSPSGKSAQFNNTIILRGSY